MSKVTLELDVREAKSLIEQLPEEDKIKLFRELMKETWSKRIGAILKNIDQRRKKLRISNQKISNEIEKARQDFYARRH